MFSIVTGKTLQHDMQLQPCICYTLGTYNNVGEKLAVPKLEKLHFVSEIPSHVFCCAYLEISYDLYYINKCVISQIALGMYQCE